MYNQFTIPMYICMKNKEELCELNDKVRTYLFMEEMGIAIQYVTTSFQALAETMIKENRTGIYILELEQVGEQELEIICKIRKKDPWGFILLMVPDDEARMRIFGRYLYIMECIVKEDIQLLTEKIKIGIYKTWQIFLENSNPWNGIFCIKSNQKIHMIHVDEIYYVEALKNQHKVILYMCNEQVESAVTLQCLKNYFVQESFFICHKSIIINMKHVKFFDKKERMVHMNNGKKVECSVRNIKRLEEILQSKSDILSDENGEKIC
ncbi:MAG: LytTR family DNA-binding domain-containing protein [Eubacteriales bacterium]